MRARLLPAAVMFRGYCLSFLCRYVGWEVVSITDTAFPQSAVPLDVIKAFAATSSVGVTVSGFILTVLLRLSHRHAV